MAGAGAEADTPESGVESVRVRVFPDPGGGRGGGAVDATPLIRGLETECEGRSVIPPDPALAFLDALLEDYADEWVTKMMFHYRWAREVDQVCSARRLASLMVPSADEKQQIEIAEQIRSRMVDRVWFVGSNEQTAPQIDSTFHQTIRQTNAHPANRPPAGMPTLVHLHHLSKGASRINARPGLRLAGQHASAILWGALSRSRR